MATRERVPMVRCRLGDDVDAYAQRYVPLAEFGLWKYLMETRHRKRVRIDAISIWVPEEPALWNSGYASEELDPVVRLQFSVRGAHGSVVPVERFFAALSYPRAQEALLSHFPAANPPLDLRATAGYFLPLAPVAEARSRLGA
jgi:hypothetical protein